MSLRSLLVGAFAYVLRAGAAGPGGALRLQPVAARGRRVQDPSVGPGGPDHGYGRGPAAQRRRPGADRPRGGRPGAGEGDRRRRARAPAGGLVGTRPPHGALRGPAGAGESAARGDRPGGALLILAPGGPALQRGSGGPRRANGGRGASHPEHRGRAGAGAAQPRRARPAWGWRLCLSGSPRRGSSPVGSRGPAEPRALRAPGLRRRARAPRPGGGLHRAA